MKQSKPLTITSLLLVALVFYSCQQHSEQSSTIQDGGDNQRRIPNLDGRWAKSDTSNIAFQIKDDSLYMFEDPVGVFYEIKEDSFIYYFDGTKFSSQIIKINADTLFLIEYGDTVRLFKMR